MVFVALSIAGPAQAGEKQIQMDLVTDQGLGERIKTPTATA